METPLSTDDIGKETEIEITTTFGMQGKILKICMNWDVFLKTFILSLIDFSAIQNCIFEGLS